MKLLQWFGLDLVLVLVFVAIGRATHGEALTPPGMVSTGWPFVLALVIGWLVARAWRAPRALTTGVIVWLVTVVGGLALRVGVAQQTAAVPFIIVATLTLALVLIGWRLIAKLVSRVASRSDAARDRVSQKN